MNRPIDRDDIQSREQLAAQESRINEAIGQPMVGDKPNKNIMLIEKIENGLNAAMDEALRLDIDDEMQQSVRIEFRCRLREIMEKGGLLHRLRKAFE